MGAKRVLLILSISVSVFFLAGLLTSNKFKDIIKQKQSHTLIDSQQKTEIILEQYMRFLYYYYNKPIFDYLDKQVPWYRLDYKLYKVYLMKQIISDLNKLTDLSEKIAGADVELYMQYANKLEQCNGELSRISETFNLDIVYLGVKY